MRMSRNPWTPSNNDCRGCPETSLARPGGRGSLPTHGSHRPVRAHIRAYYVVDHIICVNDARPVLRGCGSSIEQGRNTVTPPKETGGNGENKPRPKLERLQSTCPKCRRLGSVIAALAIQRASCLLQLISESTLLPSVGERRPTASPLVVLNPAFLNCACRLSLLLHCDVSFCSGCSNSSVGQERKMAGKMAGQGKWHLLSAGKMAENGRTCNASAKTAETRREGEMAEGGGEMTENDGRK